MATMATARLGCISGRRLARAAALLLGLLGLALFGPAALAAPDGQAGTPAQAVTAFLTAFKADAAGSTQYLSPRLRAQLQSPDALLNLVGSPGGYAHCMAPLQSFSVGPAQVAGTRATVGATLTFTPPTGQQASDCSAPPPPGPEVVARTFTLLLDNGTWQIDAIATSAPSPPAQTPARVPAQMPDTGAGAGAPGSAPALLGLLALGLGGTRLVGRRH